MKSSKPQPKRGLQRKKSGMLATICIEKGQGPSIRTPKLKEECLAKSRAVGNAPPERIAYKPRMKGGFPESRAAHGSSHSWGGSYSFLCNRLRTWHHVSPDSTTTNRCHSGDGVSKWWRRLRSTVIGGPAAAKGNDAGKVPRTYKIQLPSEIPGQRLLVLRPAYDNQNPLQCCQTDAAFFRASAAKE